MEKKNILVIRLSALGDVAMSVPIVAQASYKHNIKITVLTKKTFVPLFSELENVSIISADLTGRHKGIKGLFVLFLDIYKKEKWDGIVDLHNVIRTKALDFLFRICGISVFVIKKDRSGRRGLTRKKNKKLKLLSVIQNEYAETLTRAGFATSAMPYAIYTKENELPEELQKLTGEKAEKWIGIAPFAKHQSKIYPLEKMEKIIHYFSTETTAKIFLFGGGKSESEQLSTWQNKYANTFSLAGKISFENELRIMAHLDCMLSMDSSNMHLANLVKIPVISIWGATHPFAGFISKGHSSNKEIQLDLNCRPCSVYGNKKCYKGTYECMQNIDYKTIIREIEETINQ